MSYVLNTSCQAGVSAQRSHVEVGDREEGTARLCFRWWQFSPPRNYPALPACPLFHLPSRLMQGCWVLQANAGAGGEECQLQGPTKGEGLPSSREALIGPGSCHVRRWAVPVERWRHRGRGPFARTRWRSSGFWRRPFPTIYTLCELGHSRFHSAPTVLPLPFILK